MNNLLELFSVLSSGFGQNKNDTPLTPTNNVYGQSYPDEAYQNQQNNMATNNFSMDTNMLPMLLSMLNKNLDLTSLSAALANKSSADEQKKSPPQDDDIII